MLGGSFRLEDIAEMHGESPAVLLPAVEETMAAAITAADENEFSFRHELLAPRRGRHDSAAGP